MPEVAIGYIADSTSTYFLSRLCEKEFGMYLGVHGQRVKGIECLKTGFATHFVENKNIEKLKRELIGNHNEKTTEKEVKEIIDYYSLKVEDKTIPNIEEIKEIY